MEISKEIIAKNLIKYRKNAGLTQIELAEKIMYSDKNISKWERAESIPDIFILKQLADIYGITINDFLEESDKISKGSFENSYKKSKFMNRKQFLITSLSVSLVWLVAILFFGVLVSIPAFSSIAWYSFIIAIPITFIVVLIFTSLWCTNLLNAIIVTFLIWTTALAIFLCFRSLESGWLIFIVAIPVQILDILWFILRRVNRNLKQKKEIKK